jgi:hypothetical protein
MEGQFSGAERSAKSGDELTPKHFAEHLHRKKEAVARANPGGLIKSEPSRRNYAVSMRMMLQVLTPRMEDAQEANVGPEMTRVCCYLQQRGCAGAEQQIVKNPLVLMSKGSKLMGNSEDDMRVRNGQKLFCSLFQPPLAGAGLTPGTMPVATRVIRDGLMTAFGATVKMTSQSCSAATPNREQDFQLWPSQ